MSKKKGMVSLGSSVIDFDSLALDDFMEYSDRAQYNGSYDHLVEVPMNGFAVTNANASKPVLATYGLGPCVSLVGYSPEDKVGFLTHYYACTDMGNSFGFLLYHILKQLGKNPSDFSSDPTNFEVRLIGGYNGMSESLINSIRGRFHTRSDISMKLVEEDTLAGGGNKSVALDTRDGSLYSYNPMLNPQRKELGEFEKRLLTSGLSSTAKLAYCPED